MERCDAFRPPNASRARGSIGAADHCPVGLPIGAALWAASRAAPAALSSSVREPSEPFRAPDSYAPRASPRPSVCQTLAVPVYLAKKLRKLAAAGLIHNGYRLQHKIFGHTTRAAAEIASKNGSGSGFIAKHGLGPPTRRADLEK